MMNHVMFSLVAIVVVIVTIISQTRTDDNDGKFRVP